MKTDNRVLILIAPLSALLIGGCATVQHPNWEYKIMTNNSPGGAERQLNVLGNDGWMLIQENNDNFYFKRPKR
jgi:hypothetical protein